MQLGLGGFYDSLWVLAYSMKNCLSVKIREAGANIS